MGSGSIGVAALNTGRQFVGIERDAGYFEIAKQRLESSQFSLSQEAPVIRIGAV